MIEPEYELNRDQILSRISTLDSELTTIRSKIGNLTDQLRWKTLEKQRMIARLSNAI